MENINKKDRLAGAARQELTDEEMEQVAGGEVDPDDGVYYAFPLHSMVKLRRHDRSWLVAEIKKRRSNGGVNEYYLKFERDANGVSRAPGWFEESDIYYAYEGGASF